jgi:hypothetical protein
MGILSSPRDRAYDDLAFKLVGSLRECGSVDTTLGEYVSGVRSCFTVGMRGRSGILGCACHSPF